MEFIRARWKLVGEGPGKPTSRGVGKPGCEQKPKRDKPDRSHMTEVHPGNVGVTEGPYCKVGETGGVDRHTQEGVAVFPLHNKERAPQGGLSR